MVHVFPLEAKACCNPHANADYKQNQTEWLGTNLVIIKKIHDKYQKEFARVFQEASTLIWWYTIISLM